MISASSSRPRADALANLSFGYGTVAVLAACAAGGWIAHAPWLAAAAALAASAWAGATVARSRFDALVRDLAVALSSEERARAKTSRAVVAAASESLLEFRQRSARTHPSTGLPTREQLLAVIDAHARGATPALLGLLHLTDFDQMLAFDAVAAQQALKVFGERIARAVGGRHVLAHVDRATLAIWIKSARADEEFDALVYVAGQQLPLAAGLLTPTVSHATIVDAHDGAGAEQLLARATASLAAAFRPHVHRASGVEDDRERFALEQELTSAIERDQLSVVFQPVVDLVAKRVIGAEALLRWSHPGFGAVSPTRFIPLVERLGLSHRYGLWVLNAACREAARWRGLGLHDLRMAVNLSAEQVSDPDLEAKIERTLRRHGLPTQAIELELTETAAMADAERTREVFTRLRARGLGLAIDDFGAGYSSLSYLKNLPFTKLKIDREFVTDVDARVGSQAICKALLELGRGLELTVLAEGVETQAEVDALSRLGCRIFQGFHFSRPLDAEAFLEFVRAPPWRVAAPNRSRTPCLT